jgi:hypothetical protein
MENRGKSNPTIAIPQFRYEKKVHDIISEFVYRNFDKMVTDRKNGEIYPIKFMDIVDENS